MIHWFKNSLRGICMGVADLIPGVSGGTLALILGIYTQFVNALSALGPSMLKAVFKKEFWKRLRRGLSDRRAMGDDAIGQMASHFLFLASLALGIIGAIVIGVRFIPDLLEHYPEQMNGLFFGLVLASIIIPYRKMRSPKAIHVAPFLLFLVGTFLLVGTHQSTDERAQGTIELRFEKAIEVPLILDSTRHGGVRFMTDRYPQEQNKREIAFVPAGRTTVAKGTKRIEISVQSRMRGASGNVDSGELACATLTDCMEQTKGLPEGTTIAQNKPLEGGADPSLVYLFLAGVLAISAMVLPGISGSFILLMLGLYTYVTFSLRAAIYGQEPSALTVVGVFLIAVFVGLLTFSRVLKWLLENHHDITMAALVGLMAGSLRKLWPFLERDSSGELAPSLPSELEAAQWTTIALIVAGIVTVGLLERLGRGRINESS
jgi:uncharacterized membrane protein